MKRAICLIAIFIISLSLNAVVVSASTSNVLKSGNLIEIQPFWISASSITLSIDFSDTSASCSGLIKGKSDVSSITATYTLKKVNSNGTLTTVKSWSGLSSSTNSLGFSETYSTVSKGNTYRLEVSATLTTKSGVKENVSDSIDKTYL